MDIGPAAAPDTESLRQEAILAGATDPTILRFRMIAYDRFSGEMLCVQDESITFRGAVEKAAVLIKTQEHVHFLLEPIGFIQ